MGKLKVTKKDAKGCSVIRYKDKDTGDDKGFTNIYIYSTLSEETLKDHNLHLLDKVFAVKEHKTKNESEEEIGIVNDFYEETESND